MELKQIKELMNAMARSQVTRVALKKEGEYEIEIERKSESSMIERHHVPSFKSEYDLYHPHALPAVRSAEPMFSHAVHHVAPPTLPSDSGNEKQSSGSASVEEGKFITSPMVGTFYAAPSPEDPPFVKVGDKVDAHTVVCIVEAMKVMNEVKAGVSGVVAEVLVPSGSPLEFGTKIFRVV